MHYLEPMIWCLMAASWAEDQSVFMISPCKKLYFEVLGIDENEQREKFGFLLDALKHGAPPHGGLAFGLDRLIMLMVGAESIRDVIAFPKTQSAACLLTDAPGTVEATQLRDLNIKLRVKENKSSS